VDWLTDSIGAISDGIGHTSAFVGTTVTSGAVNVKGSYPATPLSTSTPRDAHGILIFNTAKSVSAADYLVDIAIGAAASEQIIVENLLFAAGSSSGVLRSYYLPVKVPAGARLNARSQSSTAAATLGLACALIEGDMLGVPAFDKIISIGAQTATSGGVVLGNPGAAGWGAWTELAASLAQDIGWFMACWGDNKIATRTAAQAHYCQGGRGGAGVEQAIIPPSQIGPSSTSFGGGLQIGWPVKIPAGQRVVARYGSSAITNLGMAAVGYGGVL
jgi:hypothetical protein